MFKSLHKFYIFFLLVFFSNTLYALKYIEITNLSSELSVYDKKNGVFIPYVEQKVQSLHYKFNTKKNNSIIKIKSENTLFVYLNQKLIFHKINSADTLLNLKLFKKELTTTNLITFWSSDKFESPLEILEVVSQAAIKSKNENSYQERDLAQIINKNFFLIAFLFVLGFIAVIKPLVINQSIINKIFSFKVTELDIKFNPLNWLFLVLLLFYSLIIVIFLNQYNLFSFNINNTNYILSFLHYVFIIFLTYLAKFIVLNIFEILVETNDISKKYFAEFMAMNFIFTIIILIYIIISFILQISFYDSYQYYVNFSLVLFLLIRSIRLFYFLSTNYKFHFFQVFSYLCVLEIFPWLIIVKHF